MNPIFSYLVTELVKKQLKDKKKSIPENQFDKKVSNTKVELKHLVHDVLFIAMGILSASFGLKGFCYQIHS